MCLLFDNKFINFPAIVKRVHDVSGAGDTVISVFALCDSVGLSPEKSAFFSNIAASLVCEEVGVVPINLSLLEKKIKEFLKIQLNMRNLFFICIIFFFQFISRIIPSLNQDLVHLIGLF